MDRFKANDITWMTALQSGKFYFCIYIYSHLVTGVCVIITKMSKLSISEIQGLHFTLLCLIKGNSTTFIYGTT